jgi:hypothetical protein
MTEAGHEDLTAESLERAIVEALRAAESSGKGRFWLVPNAVRYVYSEAEERFIFAGFAERDQSSEASSSP